MFSFVDQIDSIEEREIRGRFSVPRRFNGAPGWMLVEAIGQLAGWLAVANSDFTLRPVGATLGSLELRRDGVESSGVLELSATIERTDRRAILYRGEVQSAGRTIAQMQRCIGPLLPLASLEDPDEARGRVQALRESGPLELWSETHERPRALVSAAELQGGNRASATFRIDRDAELFAEHFPRQPVVPASLLIDAMCRLGAAAKLQRADATDTVAFTQVRRVKVRQFTPPGEVLHIEAVAQGGEDEVHAIASSGDDTVASVSVSGFVPCAS